MLLTTGLLFVAMRRVWRWPVWVCVGLAGFFLVVDLGFFSANLLKIVDGGWLPLTLGAVVFFIMTTWRVGVDRMRAALARNYPTPDALAADLVAGRIPRVPGAAVFLTRSDQKFPPLLIDHVRHMGALHSHVIVLEVLFEDTPRVADNARCAAESIGDGIWRVTLRFGFVEAPRLAESLARAKNLDAAIDLENAVWFATRDFVVPEPGRPGRWRMPLFAFLYRNAARAVDRFDLPWRNVVEIARQIQI